MTNSYSRVKSKKLYPKLIKCEMCNSEKNLVRHHLDYNKPEKIIVLCRKCHSKWHKENKAENAEHFDNKLKRLPNEMIYLIRKIQEEAKKQDYIITETEAMKLIVKRYKSK
jgi:predicted metal-binding protein